MHSETLGTKLVLATLIVSLLLPRDRASLQNTGPCHGCLQPPVVKDTGAGAPGTQPCILLCSQYLEAVLVPWACDMLQSRRAPWAQGSMVDSTGALALLKVLIILSLKSVVFK